jgi:hypothetical protein
MKRINLTILALLSVFSGLFAQNVDDALRYSQLFYGGTARFMSMGGAFTALGGDMSSLTQNPAGLGVFRASEISISPQLNYIKSTAGFNGTASDYLYDFNLSQIGIVSNMVSHDGTTGLLKLNFGYSFNKTNNYTQTIRIQGVNTNSSMADTWALAGNENNTLYHDLTGPEGIAYDAWVIDTVTGSGGRSYATAFSNYGDNPPSKYGQNVRRLVSNEGFSGEHAISIGGNYSNKVFFGATFGVTQLRYTSHFQHIETTDGTLPSQLKSFDYTDHYEDRGTGYSLKLGAIIKPIEAIRIGLAFHSPTWYHVKEYFFESISSNFTDGNRYESSNDPMRFSYSLSTPFRVLAGIGIQVKKIALLSADYEFVDYSTAKFSDPVHDFDYSTTNDNIKSTLKSANNIRLGAEIRLNKLYLRSGYGYYGKAFRAGDDNANLDYNSLAFGAGFREQNVSVDFAFTRYDYSRREILYALNDSFEPALANITTMQNLFTVTFAYRFGY